MTNISCTCPLQYCLLNNDFEQLFLGRRVHVLILSLKSLSKFTVHLIKHCRKTTVDKDDIIKLPEVDCVTALKKAWISMNLGIETTERLGRRNQS